jgi:hypothetical protein
MDLMVEATGQALCTFLTKAGVAALYKPTKNPAGIMPYILHTEPSLGRNDNYGITSQAQLKWYDAAWVGDFVRMVVDISDFLGAAAAKIEIHPGDRRNSFADIVQAIRKIQEGFDQAFGKIPEVLLENRTGQVVSNGEEIAKYWVYLTTKEPGLKELSGIVFNIRQFKTVTKNKFEASFSKIPDECLKGFHIHTLHRPPKATDSIPWDSVFAKIAGLLQDIVINPEIHHGNKVRDVIAFCDRPMARSR